MADKKLTELPITTGLSENDLIYVVQGGISKQIKYSDFEISDTGDENRVIQLSPLSIVTDPNDVNGVALKIPVVPLVPIWRISSVDYSKTTETIIPIPYAGNDMYRVDIIVGNTNNEFVRIQGQERTDVGVPPDIPNGTIEITRLNIFGQNVGDPSPPPSYGYITKSSKQYRHKRLTTIAPTELLLSPEYSTYSLEAWAGSGIVMGFISFTNNVTYDGMDIFIKNNRNIDIILTHNDANAAVPIWFKDGNDFILKQDEIIQLKYNLANNRVEFVGFVGGGGVQSVTGDGVDNTDPENPVVSFPKEEDIRGTAVEININSGTFDLSVASHYNLNVISNSLVTFIGLPRVGKSYTRTLIAESSTGVETLSFANSTNEFGSYDPSKINFITVMISHTSNDGVVINVFYAQAN